MAIVLLGGVVAIVTSLVATAVLGAVFVVRRLKPSDRQREGLCGSARQNRADDVGGIRRVWLSCKEALWAFLFMWLVGNASLGSLGILVLVAAWLSQRDAPLPVYALSGLGAMAANAGVMTLSLRSVDWQAKGRAE